MSRLSSLLDRHGIDALVAVSAVGSALEIILAGDANEAPQTPVWFSVTAAVLIALPLALRRQFPFGAPALIWLLAAVLSFVDGRIVAFPVGVYLAGMVAALLLGHLEGVAQARRGLAVVVASAVVVAFNDPAGDVGELVFTPLLFAVLWVTGYALRQRIVDAETAQRRASSLEHERDESERRAVFGERTRIAREMHDVVGHSLSVMTVQAAAVRRLLTAAQTREREALLSVEETGREALNEMRRLVTVLRDPDDTVSLAPPPGLEQLPTLLEHTRTCGLPVELTIEGAPLRLPAAVDLVAYRVVQEGLTNAIRHANADHAEVHVRYGRHHLEVEVVDNGPGSTPSGEGGQGLAGMRERVGAYQGRLDAGPCDGGGYRLHALLPVHA
jgi:signal transduction histidine kinase